MYLEDYEDYFEPSEFDDKCNELIEFLKSKAKKEIQEELEKLRKENEELRPIKSALDKKFAELEREKENYKWKESLMRDQITRELKRARLSELLSDFTETLYVVRNKPIQQPKCDKCDENRRQWYTTPLGKKAYENCTCAEEIPHYIVKEAECSSFKICDWDSEFKGKLVGWYRILHDRDYDYFESAVYAMNGLYKGELFENIKDFYHVYFKDKEKAQEYANWLNNK